MQKIIGAIAISMLISGCAKKADSIKAIYVSSMVYDSKSCKQLRDEVIKVNKRLSIISGQQADVANKDAVVMGVGLVIFWPALLLLAEGDDQKAEIGNLKGQYNTIRDVAAKKNCSFAAGMR